MSVAIYYVVVIVYFTLLLFSNINKKFFRISPYVILATFSGFRYGVGTDYFNYQNLFSQLSRDVYPWKIEIGYRYLVLFVNKIGGTQQLVFLIMSSLTVFFTYKLIKEESSNFIMSSLLYLLIGPFYLSSMNGIRQALAIAMVSYSLKFVRNGNYLKSSIITVIAGLFHSSAFLMLPITIIMRKRYKIKNYLLIFMCIFTIAQSNISIKIIDLLDYGKYNNYGDYSTDKTLFIFVAIGVIIMYIVEKFGIDEKMNLYYNMSLGSLMIILLTLLTNNVTSMVFMRFNNYFFNSYLILIPVIINKFKERELINVLVFVFALVYFSLVIFSSNSMIPYQLNFRIF